MKIVRYQSRRYHNGIEYGDFEEIEVSDNADQTDICEAVKEDWMDQSELEIIEVKE